MNNVPAIIPQHKTCYKCSYEAQTGEVRCPRCGKKLWTKTETRIMGAVLAVLGSFLIVVMAAIIIFMIGVMSQPSNASGARFNGTPAQALMVLGILGFVLLFGFTSLVAGLWQMIFARRNMVLIWVILVLGGVFLVGGTIASTILEN